MEYDINVRISNKHIHLNKETYDLLFDNEISVKKELNQKGQFAANETVTLRNGDKVIEHVRLVGPLRSYNQVELSKRDARILGLNPPVRRSGELDNTPEITLETPKGSVTTNGVIISCRHIHMTQEEAEKFGVVDKEKVAIKIENDKAGVITAEVKISDDAYYEAHIDTDDANAFLLDDNDKAKMII